MSIVSLKVFRMPYTFMFSGKAASHQFYQSRAHAVESERLSYLLHTVVGGKSSSGTAFLSTFVEKGRRVCFFSLAETM